MSKDTTVLPSVELLEKLRPARTLMGKVLGNVENIQEQIRAMDTMLSKLVVQQAIADHEAIESPAQTSKEQQMLDALRSIETTANNLADNLDRWTNEQTPYVLQTWLPTVKRIQHTAHEAITHATPTKSQDVSATEPDIPKCPGCGEIWTAGATAYFKEKHSQDPPYICADCREKGGDA